MSYQAFIDACLKVCHCCSCANPPCDGTMAGGFCDNSCFCGAKDDFYWGEHSDPRDYDEEDSA